MSVRACGALTAVLMMAGEVAATDLSFVQCEVSSDAEVLGAYINGVPMSIKSQCGPHPGAFCVLTFFDQPSSQRGQYLSVVAKGLNASSADSDFCQTSSLTVSCFSTDPKSDWNNARSSLSWKTMSLDAELDTTEWTVSSFNATGWETAEASGQSCSGCVRNGNGVEPTSIWASGCEEYAYFRLGVPEPVDCEGSWGDWTGCECDTNTSKRVFDVAVQGSSTGAACQHDHGHTEEQRCDCEDHLIIEDFFLHEPPRADDTEGLAWWGYLLIALCVVGVVVAVAVVAVRVSKQREAEKRRAIAVHHGPGSPRRGGAVGVDSRYLVNEITTAALKSTHVEYSDDDEKVDDLDVDIETPKRWANPRGAASSSFVDEITTAALRSTSADVSCAKPDEGNWQMDGPLPPPEYHSTEVEDEDFVRGVAVEAAPETNQLISEMSAALSQALQ